MEIVVADTESDLAAVWELFQEYMASLSTDACRFHDFERHISELPGEYGLPHGRLFLARNADTGVGCVALRRLEPEVGELKRLYVRPQFQGVGTGRRLVEAAIAAARQVGYRRVRLDTLRTMQAAGRLYRSLGFQEIAPYVSDPIDGAVFMELRLARGAR